jgi:hypothetical protein
MGVAVFREPEHWFLNLVFMVVCVLGTVAWLLRFPTFRTYHVARREGIGNVGPSQRGILIPYAVFPLTIALGLYLGVPKLLALVADH